MKQLVLLPLVLFFIFSCDLQYEAVPSPPKPESVPHNAFWVGGHEGGVYILISAQQDKKTYSGTIYFDTNGEIGYQGKFNTQEMFHLMWRINHPISGGTVIIYF